MERQTARLAIVAIAFVGILASALVLYSWGGGSAPGAERTVEVLAYSSFINSWGPGPEVARRFEEKTGVHVVFHDGGDAGLLLKKLQLFPSDVVVGLDQFVLQEALRSSTWKVLKMNGMESAFIPFDKSPLAFVYRKGEIEPPTSLDDLLSPRFAKTIAIEDPRSSSPGLQFLLWIIEEKGLDGAFTFLEKLKPSIHTVGASWSTAYGVFQDKKAKLVLSYLTSPLYHSIIEKNSDYAAAVFSSGHPVQTEFAGVPEKCRHCEYAKQFVAFLLEPDIQRIIMEKNFMMPVDDAIRDGTPFADLPNVKTIELKSATQHLENREAIFERWKKVGL
jgi:thiamine transport system substrate-binding protein